MSAHRMEAAEFDMKKTNNKSEIETKKEVTLTKPFKKTSNEKVFNMKESFMTSPLGFYDPTPK